MVKNCRPDKLFIQFLGSEIPMLKNDFKQIVSGTFEGKRLYKVFRIMYQKEYYQWKKNK